MSPASSTTWQQRIVHALRDAGGRARMAQLEAELGATKNTVRKHLQTLIEDGRVEQFSHGQYRLADEAPLSSDTGNELLTALAELGYDAHITGFDLLVPYAHQFVFKYPHLIYAEPSASEALIFELPNRGFVVLPAGPGPKPSGPDLSRVVVLRNQANAEQYGVRGHLAPVEKAWVDALRETVRGNLDLSYMELGRILRGLSDEGADMRYLRRYARQLGYLDRVDGASQPGEEKHPETRALQAGFFAP